MNVTPNAKGWIESVPVQVNIRAIKTRSCTVANWVSFGRGHPKLAEQRAVCDCCKTPWEETGSVWVNMVNVIEAPNRVICDNCVTLLTGTYKGLIK